MTKPEFDPPVFRGETMREFARADTFVGWHVRIGLVLELQVRWNDEFAFWSISGLAAMPGDALYSSPQEAADGADRALDVLAKMIARKGCRDSHDAT